MCQRHLVETSVRNWTVRRMKDGKAVRGFPTPNRLINVYDEVTHTGQSQIIEHSWADAFREIV